MRLALIAYPQLIALEAGAAPPRDRTSRVDKALAHCKQEWSQAYQLAQTKGLTASKALRMASVAYKPVSYTHLDVYKRQSMSRAARR